MIRRKHAAGVAVLLAGVLAVGPQITGAQSPAAWPTFHGDGTRDGVSAANGTKASTAVNIFQIDSSLQSFLPSSPAVDSSGNAYIGDESGNVYRLSPSSPAAPVWTQKLKAAVESTPSLSPDGKTLYVGADDGTLTALATSDGHVVWTQTLSSQIHASPLVSSDGGTLFVPTLNGVVFALKASDGSTVWQFTPGGAIPGSAAASPDGSTIYVAAGTYLFGIPSSGSTNGSGTRFYLDGNASSTPAVDANGNIYVGTSNGFLDCFTPTGTGCWSNQRQISSAASVTSSPTFINGTLVYGGGKYIYGLNQQNGSQNWQTLTGAGVNSSPAVAKGNNMIYVGSSDGVLYALDPSGNVVFKRTQNSPIDTSPAIAPDGSVWFATRAGTVVRMAAINPPATPPAQPSGTPATSTPVATGTGTVPTATPSPTTSPTPTQVPLTFTLKASIKPGQKQVISLTSAPNTVVHVRVTYPNGDHQSHAVTTDASGHATYTYTQAPSKLTHNKFSVTVKLTAGTGAAQNVATNTYKLGFGTIDVSAEPRSLKAGQTVDIFVHEKPKTHVVVYLSPPKGKLITLRGTTGPKGFASIKYKVNGQIVTSTKRTVTVLAKVVGNPNVATRTTFKVK